MELKLDQVEERECAFKMLELEGRFIQLFDFVAMKKGIQPLPQNLAREDIEKILMGNSVYREKSFGS